MMSEKQEEKESCVIFNNIKSRSTFGKQLQCKITVTRSYICTYILCYTSELIYLKMVIST